MYYPPIQKSSSDCVEALTLAGASIDFLVEDHKWFVGGHADGRAVVSYWWSWDDREEQRLEGQTLQKELELG